MLRTKPDHQKDKKKSLSMMKKPKIEEKGTKKMRKTNI